MNALYRLRLASQSSRTRLLSVSLLLASTATFGSGLPRTTLPPLRAARPSLPAVALFERNDPPRAERLARLELLRHPHDADALFVAMEAARLQDEQPRELHNAIALCKLLRDQDPRAQAAALRLSSFGVNSETLRRERDAVEALASGDSGCTDAAQETLYEAALDGLPQADVRAASAKAGWITKWSISRISATARPAEEFEFVDARIQLPDYFPRAAQYSANASFFVPVSGAYLVSGDVKGAKLAVDGNETNSGAVELQPGVHQLRLTFSGSDSRLRIRVTSQPAPAFDAIQLKVLAAENIYLRALLAFADGRAAEATELVNGATLARTEIGKRLLEEAASASPSDAQFESASAHPSCGNLHAALNTASTSVIGEQLLNCAPDSLAYAQWLATSSRHGDAIHELGRVLQDWPLDRDAHRMLIAELQRSGNSVAADRAAAEFMTIAPNARNFRRMAQNASAADAVISAVPFYERYRRPAPVPIASWKSAASAVILLQDKVAIARPDGSVSLYMHRVVQLMNSEGADEFRALAAPEGAQLLTVRVVNNAHPLPSPLKAGDEVEEEYVVNYTGDGGMIAHPEAFQYVFNDFDFPLLDARFVVLSPSNQSPGYVIASGPVPDAEVEYADGLRAQIWEKSVEAAAANAQPPAIIRIVENENGWSIPPSVERKRILETIHPGPRNREA